MTDAADIDRNRELADQGDLDGLLLQVENLAERRSWDALEDLRTRSLAAFERGHQLWPASAAAAYRLALDAPAELAVRAALEGNSPFTIGPLTEVVAQNHDFASLDTYLPDGPERSVIAQERVVRGEDLTATDLDSSLLGLPLTLADWERYAEVVYRPDRGDFAPPPLPAVAPVQLPSVPDRLEPDDVVVALRACVAAWLEQSNGRADISAVEGTAEAAIAALGARSVRAGAISSGDAIAHLAWAAASGAAEGRRRGMAAGRLDAWWAGACAAAITDDWPVSAADLGEAMGDLRWLAWRTDEPIGGWELYLAIEDPDHGVAWAIGARDDDLDPDAAD